MYTLFTLLFRAPLFILSTNVLYLLLYRLLYPLLFTTYYLSTYYLLSTYSYLSITSYLLSLTPPPAVLPLFPRYSYMTPFLFPFHTSFLPNCLPAYLPCGLPTPTPLSLLHCIFPSRHLLRAEHKEKLTAASSFHLSQRASHPSPAASEDTEKYFH